MQHRDNKVPDTTEGLSFHKKKHPNNNKAKYDTLARSYDEEAEYLYGLARMSEKWGRPELAKKERKMAKSREEYAKKLRNES